jgi:large subunit ribosomal protein L23
MKLIENPFDIIKSLHVTEKSMMLQELKNRKSNPCVAKCNSPKYVFLVNKNANKQQIAEALEEIYKERKIKVVSVNTINLKPKKRRVRGRIGKTAAIKKAVVTLDVGDSIDNI